jgi:hypothetical protein
MRIGLIGMMMMGLFGCGDDEAKPKPTDTGVIPEGATPGDCSDGEDNDDDGLIDCEDDGCAGASACEEVPEDTGDSGEPWPVTLPPELEGYIDVVVIPEGDFTCMETGWVEDAVSEDLQGTASMTATVAELHSETPFAPARFENFAGDDPTSAVVSETDNEWINPGDTWSGELAQCTPSAHRVSSSRLIGASRPTVTMHAVIPADSDHHTAHVVLPALDTLLKSAISIGAPQLSADKGVLFGQVLDCAGDPARGIQVVLLDADGAPLEEQVRVYSKEDSDAPAPDAAELYTSVDGWWFVPEVPVGAWTASFWMSDGDSGHIQVAEVPMQTVLDIEEPPLSVWTHADAHVGHLDGTVYPDSCAE